MKERLAIDGGTTPARSKPFPSCASRGRPVALARGGRTC
jgi:hypothetical protein